MEKCNSYRKSPPFVRWLLTGIPILFIIAVPLHFLYDWTMENKVVGLFAPVNESLWEHLKLAFFPILIWYIAGYYRFGRSQKRDWPKYVLSCAAAEIGCFLFIPAFFYTYTGAFGIESLILDIFSLLLALLFSFLPAIHIWKFAKTNTAAGILALALLVLMCGAFFCFTYFPPHIPLFADPTAGS